MDVVPIDHIRGKILLIRGRKVMLDRDLAEMYGVETRVMNQSVKRNISRFPDDFMLQLTKDESEWLVSQNVIPHKKYLGGSLPNAFTENGVAMLSSVLNSERAIQVNISIMRNIIMTSDGTLLSIYLLPLYRCPIDRFCCVWGRKTGRGSGSLRD